MKTIILKDSKVSIYLFDDDKNIDIANDKITVGKANLPDFYIADCNSENCELVNNVIAPDDWEGHKYIYDNGFVLISEPQIKSQTK